MPNSGAQVPFSHGMWFTRETGYKACCRQVGLARAGFWRALGGPNLERASAARRQSAARLRAEKAYSTTVSSKSRSEDGK
jgi:hypothetical protein